MNREAAGPPIALFVWAVLLFAPCATAADAQRIEGFTEPYQTIEVAAAEPGIISGVEVAEGDEVRKNQLLATLDLDVLTATLEIAEARRRATGRLDAAVAERNLARTKVEKLRALRAEGHSSQSELERAEADLAVAEAKLVTAEEDREISRLECLRIQAQIERRKIRSPIDGCVVEVNREVGEAVRSVDPTILTIVDLASLRARFPLSVGQAAGFRVGDDVIVTFPETSQQVRGKVTVVAPVAEARSGTTEIVVVVDNPQRQYRSGMRCTLRRPTVTPGGSVTPPENGPNGHSK